MPTSDEVDRIVDAWERERPDLDFAPLQVLSRVGRLSKHLDRARRSAFERASLESWEFDVLSALRRAGSPYQLSPKQLLQQTLVSSGTDWQNPSSLSTLLSSGTTYYLHIVATNAGGPDAFLGQFHLDDALHAFANGTQDLFTNVADWAASAVASGDPWSAPTAPVQSFGQNGDGSTIWSTTHGGPIAAIDPSAEWIWSVPDNGDAAFFSTKIVATTPIPASLPLLATAIGGLGFMARRKRSAQSA